MVWYEVLRLDRNNKKEMSTRLYCTSIRVGGNANFASTGLFMHWVQQHIQIYNGTNNFENN